MFAFYETTRRRICRTAFILLCVAPTLATAGWIVERRLPGRPERQAARLERLLQCRIGLRGYREPRPGTFECDELTLTDPRTDETVLTLSDVRLAPRDGEHWISAGVAKVPSRQLDRLAGKIAPLLSAATKVVELRVGELVAVVPDGASAGGREASLGAAHVRLDLGSTGAARLRIALREPSAEKSRVQLIVERSTSGKSSFSAVLEALEPLPACLLPGVPGFASLGSDARFTGVVQWSADAQGPVGAAKGQLEDAPLSAVLPPGSPHRVTGRGTAALSEMRWRGGRLERLAGLVVAEKAEVSPSLLKSATTHLYCIEGSVVAPSGDPPMIAVERLACRFELDNRGLTVTGEVPGADQESAGCLASAGGRPLLMQPQYVDIPAGAWVQFVAGPAASWMPASAGALKVAERLPLP